MRVGANDQVCTPIRKALCQCTLRIHNGMTVFHAPVHTHHHKICKLTCRFYLLLDHIGLAGIDHIGLHGAVLRDAIGMLCVGKICDRYTIDSLQRDMTVVAFSLPQTDRYNILRHTAPEAQGSGNAGSAFIVGVVIGQAEHPHTRPVKRTGAIARRRKAWVGGWLQFIRAERFLIDPVHIMLCIKRRNMFVTVIETVSFLSGSAALRLLINGSVDQIISCCRKADNLNQRLRFRLWRRLCFFRL